MFNGGNLQRKLRQGQAAVGTIAYFGSPAFMGMDDLRQSMGLLGVRDHPELDEDEKVEEIFGAARVAGMPFGTFVGSAEACRSWIDRGALLMTVGSDLEFRLNGLDREMDRLKGPDRSGQES